uniref:Uncharacterized protein n=1 Tax=viral metagenome TaxID=1070528 RepID=A0A6C0B2F0_9ZZZZ
MQKDNTTILGYMGHGVLFIVELSLIPYYQLEYAYYRAEGRIKKFYQ